MQHNLVARGSPHPYRLCPGGPVQNNSDRPGPQNSVVPLFEGVAQPLRRIFPGNAKRRDENGLAHNWAAAGALRKIP